MTKFLQVDYSQIIVGSLYSCVHLLNKHMNLYGCSTYSLNVCCLMICIHVSIKHSYLSICSI